MKRFQPKHRRDVFVLTPEETRTLAFILAALLLGLGAKYYRQRRSTPPARVAVVAAAHNVGLPADKRAEAKRRKAARP